MITENISEEVQIIRLISLSILYNAMQKLNIKLNQRVLNFYIALYKIDIFPVLLY